MIDNILKEYRLQVYDNLNGVFSKENIQKCKESQKLIEQSNILYFIGNGGSFCSCCSHLSEDFIKVANKRAMSLDSVGLLSCLSNDYSYEDAYKEWLKRFWICSEHPLLIAISSSGESKNILNAVNYIKSLNGNIITLSAHSSDNKLSKLGNINFHLPTKNYGAAETYHQLLLHMILDSIVEDKNDN